MSVVPAPSPTAETIELRLDDVPVGSLRMVRVAGRRLCLVRTSEGVSALDHACPHEGYGLTQGQLDGDLLTCAWHNWKFRVTDGACVLGEEAVTTHRVDVDNDGRITITLHQPDPARQRVTLRQSLRSAIERNYLGQISRDVVRLLQADENPGELVWEAVAYGAPRAEFGWGHSIAAATDCVAMLDLYDGDQRALPIVQAIAGTAEAERGRPVNRLPQPATALPADPGAAFRAHVEREELPEAQALVRGAIHSGRTADELQRWFTSVVCDHLLSYGHGAIYAQKAFQLLDLLGWERADTVLPHLVPTIVNGTREDTLPYMRPYMREVAKLDLDALAAVEPDPSWVDDGGLVAALLGSDRVAPLHAVAAALRDGAGVDGVLDAVVTAVSRRMMRYDTAGEFDLADDFGWLDITHGLTYANAARWHHQRLPGPDSVRLALFCAFLAMWTGRHEWHTTVGPPSEPADLGADVIAAGQELQRRSLDDRTSATIVHAHAVKTSRAAAIEAARTGSLEPLHAVTRFMDSPRLERFVAANVTRSIEFLNGRAPRD